MRPFTVLHLVVMISALGGCGPSDPLKRLASQLEDAEQREQAINGLLLLIRQAPASQRAGVQRRVVEALVGAYEEDRGRVEIVTALALLKDPGAEAAYVGALAEAERDGVYLEAALRAARALGELGLRHHVPELVSALREANRAAQPERSTWLQRALIEALERLGDTRSVEALLAVLKGNPARQDFYLNRLAAHALGTLRDPRAVPGLVASLGATGHGLLLYEESRQALCRLGDAARRGLLATAGARDRQHRPVANAAAAVRVLGDLGEPAVVDALLGLLRPGDPEVFRLAVAETALRLGRQEGEPLLLALLRDPALSLTTRRQAAELLGWYGSRVLGELLVPTCEKPSPAQDVLCWTVALSYCRQAGPGETEALDRLRTVRADTLTQHYLEAYAARLAVVRRCGTEVGCYEDELTRATDWRAQERSALELARRGAPGAAVALARRLAGAHPQLRQAILVGLERLPLAGAAAAKVRELLHRELLRKDAAMANPPGLASQMLCLEERLKRKDREER